MEGEKDEEDGSRLSEDVKAGGGGSKEEKRAPKETQEGRDGETEEE